jgi:hypothetical protein
MWELNHGSYYKLEGDEEDKNLVASLINHGPDDGVNPNTWGVQIHPADGGLVVIGHIPADMFSPEYGQAVADAALTENKPYDWWEANQMVWFLDHAVALL